MAEFNAFEMCRFSMRTHYDVLHLGKNCSAKEIKDSFLKLSKVYHPDKNKRPDAHSKFVEVNEAYSVLGRKESRLRYDESLCAQTRANYKTGGFSEPHQMRTYENFAYMYTKGRDHDTETTNFIKSKVQMFFFCCVLILMGTLLQLKALKNQRYIRSHEIAVAHKKTRERSMKMNKELIEQLRKASE